MFVAVSISSSRKLLSSFRTFLAVDIELKEVFLVDVYKFLTHISLPFLLVFLHPFYFAKPFHSSFLANSKSSFWFCNYFFSFVTTSGHFTFKMNYLYQFYLKMVEFFESFIVQISQVHKNIYRIYGFVLILFFLGYFLCCLVLLMLIFFFFLYLPWCLTGNRVVSWFSSCCLLY